MAMQANNYQCPCCGSVLTYSGQAAKMKCASCGNEYPVEALDQYMQNASVQDTPPEAIQWDKPSYAYGGGEDTEHLRAFHCPGCGAEMVVSDTSAADTCPYCGNPAVMPGVLEGSFRPSAVIPFVKTKEDARKAFRELCAKNKLLPRNYASDSVVEKITGVYVPFWLFDCETEGDVTYKATRVRTHRQGNYEVVDTLHYSVRRGGRFSFADVPVNSSTKLDDTLMEAVEPFDAASLVAYTPAYLSGYQAERYDQGVETCQTRAGQRVRESVVRACRETVQGYTSVTPVNTRVQMLRSRSRNVLMPVWMLTTNYRGKKYVFAMNGQTGQIKGDLPMDPGKAVRFCILFFLLMTGCLFALMYLLYTTGVLV